MLPQESGSFPQLGNLVSISPQAPAPRAPQPCPTQLLRCHACSSQERGEMHLHHACTDWMQPWSPAVPVPRLQSLRAPSCGTDPSLLAWEVAGSTGRGSGLPPRSHQAITSGNRGRAAGLSYCPVRPTPPVPVHAVHSLCPHSGARTRVAFPLPSPPGQPLGSNPGCDGCRGHRHHSPWRRLRAWRDLRAAEVLRAGG